MEQKLQPQTKPKPFSPPKQTPKQDHINTTNTTTTQYNPILKQQNHEKLPNITKPKNNNNNNNNNKVIWDCGSTLYDSFELNSFQKQLDSAIINSTRTLSMPRLPSQDHRSPPQQQPPPPTSWSKKSKLSRSFQKLIKSVFRASKPNTRPNYDSSSPDHWFTEKEIEEKKMKGVDNGRYFVVFEKPNNGLSTIPEVPEFGLSPDIKSLVTKTMSDRFSFKPTTTTDGIYCI